MSMPDPNGDGEPDDALDFDGDNLPNYLDDETRSVPYKDRINSPASMPRATEPTMIRLRDLCRQMFLQARIGIICV